MRYGYAHKWITFRIAEGRKITIDEVGDPSPTDTIEEERRQFDALRAKMTETETPRYIIYDFGFMLKSGVKTKQLAFIFW